MSNNNNTINIDQLKELRTDETPSSPNGHSLQDEDRPLTNDEMSILCAYIEELKRTGEVNANRPFLCAAEMDVKYVESIARKTNGNVRAIGNVVEEIGLQASIDKWQSAHKTSSKKEYIQESLTPSLPDGVLLDKSLGAGACPWLDEYEALSKYWSPRGYEHFHTGCGLFVLSVIAARRVRIQFGPSGDFTPLYIALVATSTKNAKTETTRIAEMVLCASGLDWLLGAGTTTPQKLLSSMAGDLPVNYGALSPLEQERAVARFGMSAQRGWIYDEFGGLIDAMTSKQNTMQPFKEWLRKFDDCKSKADNDTLGRGYEVAHKPYLALLAGMTIADIAPHADKKGKFWNDGTFARFSFIVPPPSARSKARFPKGECEVPQSLVKQLVDWHKRLGMPETVVAEKQNNKGETTGHDVKRLTELPEVTLPLGEGIEDAYYNYDSALSDIVDENPALSHFSSWYSRLARKALRIAAIFASIGNCAEITVAHFARAQHITEAWRASLHGLYAQVKAGDTDTSQSDEEDEIIRAVQKLCDKGKPPTARDLSSCYLKRYDTPTIAGKLRYLSRPEVGVLREITGGKAPRYELASEENNETSEDSKNTSK